MSVNWQNKARDSERQSHEAWLSDLVNLFDNAKSRFSDISWKQDGDDDEVVYAHKAILYARAPSQFLTTYFPRLASGNAANTHATDTHPHDAHNNIQSLRSLSVSPSPSSNPASNTLILPPSTSPAILSSALKFLYTADDGDSFDFLFDQPLVDKQSTHERQEKMRMDLVYMWRSTLFSDVKIVLVGDENGRDGHRHDIAPDADNDSVDEDDEEIDATFSAHRAVLASRSTYFANILSTHSGFLESIQNANTDRAPRTITLHQPPFTPASLHFALGYIYAGTVMFSNRTLDLGTAFEVYDAAEYLDIHPLKQQIVATIAEMAGYFKLPLSNDTQHSYRQILHRVPRILAFAVRDTTNEPDLEASATELCVKAFGDLWSKDIAELPYPARKKLVKGVNFSVGAANLVNTLRGVAAIRGRLANEMRFSGWVNELNTMIKAVDGQIKRVLGDNLGGVLDSSSCWDLVHGVGFSSDIFDCLLGLVVEILNDDNCAMVYQLFVEKLLRREDEGRGLTPSTRETCEDARKKILRVVKNRWMNVKLSNVHPAGGFGLLDSWALEELSRELGIPVSDLLEREPSPPRMTRRVVKKSTSSLRKEDGEGLRASVLRSSAGTSQHGPATGRRTTSTSSTTTSRQPRTLSISGASPSRGTPPRAEIPPRRAGSLNTPSGSSTPTMDRSPQNTASRTPQTPSRYPTGRRPVAHSTASARSVGSASVSGATRASRTSSTTTYSKSPATPTAGDDMHKRSQSAQSADSKQSTRNRNGSQIPIPMRNHTLSTNSGREKQNQSGSTSTLTPPPSRRMSTPSPSLIPTHAMRVRKTSTTGGGIRGVNDGKKTDTKEKKEDKPNTSNAPTTIRKNDMIENQKKRIPSQLQKNNEEGPHPRPRPQSQSGSSVRSLAAKFEGGSQSESRPVSAVLPESREDSEKKEKEKKERSEKETELKETKENEEKERLKKEQAEKEEKEEKEKMERETSEKKIKEQLTIDEGSAKENSKQQEEEKENEQVTPIGTNPQTPTDAHTQTPQKRSHRSRSDTLKHLEKPLEDVDSTPRATFSGSDKSSPKSAHGLSSLSLAGGIETDDDENESVPSRIPSLSLTEHSLATHKSMASLVEHTDSPSPPKNKPKTPKRVIEPYGVTLNIGIPCIIACKPKRRDKSSSSVRFRALVRYLGTLANEIGPWVGVEIPSEEITEEKLNSVSGWNDGIFQDRRYFDLKGEKWNAMEPRPSLNLQLDARSKSGTSKRSMSSGHRTISGLSAFSEFPVEETKPLSNQPHKALFVRPANVVWVVNT